MPSIVAQFVDTGWRDQTFSETQPDYEVIKDPLWGTQS